MYNCNDHVHSHVNAVMAPLEIQTETVFFLLWWEHSAKRERETTTAVTVFLAAQQQRHLILHFYLFLKGTEASV